MSDAHDKEIGYFVDSLSPHQRVVLQRLLGECLTVLPRGNDDVTIDRLQLVTDGMRPLQTLLDHLRQYAPGADEDSDIRPFSLNIPQAGQALLTLSRKILTWNAIWEEKAHSWLKDVQVHRLTVDVSRLDEFNSSTIAWLVTLAQRLPDGKLVLRGTNLTMRRALGVLHLEKVLIPEG